MQRSGTEEIRTQSQPSKPKREITKITNSQNTKRTYSQPSEQLFPKRWPLSNRNRTKNNMNKHKVKRHRNSDTKTGNREPQQNYRLGTVSNELLGRSLTCFTAPVFDNEVDIRPRNDLVKLMMLWTIGLALYASKWLEPQQKMTARLKSRLTYLSPSVIHY